MSATSAGLALSWARICSIVEAIIQLVLHIKDKQSQGTLQLVHIVQHLRPNLGRVLLLSRRARGLLLEFSFVGQQGVVLGVDLRVREYGCMFGVILFLELQLAVVVLVAVLQSVNGVLLDGFVVLLGLDGDNVVFSLLLLVDVTFAHHPR